MSQGLLLVLGNLKKWNPQEAHVASPAPDDLRRYLQLRNICCMAKVCAARMNREGPQRTINYERQLYRSQASEAVALARDITDAIYRTSSMYYLIDLFMGARDEAYARALFATMDAGPMRERALKLYPKLRTPN